jgi:hypothetical protein
MWTFNEEEYNKTPEDYQGFVYQITELDSNKKYIGKKNFWKPKTLPITKSRKRRVRTRTESDWREYYGSSDEVRVRIRLLRDLVIGKVFGFQKFFFPIYLLLESNSVI